MNKAKRPRKVRKSLSITKGKKIHSKDIESSGNAASSMCILDLNDDCLEEIFSYLTKVDLINVIKSNTRFKGSSVQSFKRKFCQDPIIVSSFHVAGASVQTFKHSMAILKHFGAVISKLCIKFKLESVENLLESVTANCTESLFELELQHLGAFAIKPSAAYVSGAERMKSLLSTLNTQFTKLRHLKIVYYCKIYL